GLLSRAGFRVPEAVVVLPEASDLSFLEKELLPFLGHYDGLFAVRSSAVDEDGAVHSFAGQLESFLNVPKAEVLEKIRLVRQSGFSERIVLYRKQAGLSLPPPVPAVLIQHMVPSEVAGVAFSADPVSGRRGVVTVAAIRGLGDALVSGEKTGDTFHVDRGFRIIQREVLEPGKPTLSDSQIVAVAKLARKAAAHFGRPQDIEWAIVGGILFLLQSRPITSLGRQIDPDGAWQLWDNSNIAESYCGATTPLTFSFARHVYEEVYRQFVRILRVPSWRIEANRDVFGRMLGLIRGHVFYNLLSWYRVLAMLPGFAVNRHFMEQMMGVKESLPEEVVREIVGAPRRSTLRDYWEIGGTVLGLIVNHVSLPKKIGAFYRRLEDALKPGDVALEDMRPDELAAAYRHLQNQLLTRWDAPLINDFFAMIYFGISRKLVDRWCGDPDGTLQNDLISCQGGIISAEPAKRMIHLANLARQAPGFLAVLEAGSLADIEDALTRHPEFQQEYLGYLEKFGDRCLEELKLESATLHDNPLMLLRSVARLAASPERPTLDTESLARAASMRADNALVGHPWRKLIFPWVIGQTRDRVRNRENLRFERTRVFGRVRRIFVELGKRLSAQDRLEHPRDIFYLEAEESMGFVEGNAVTTDLKGLARLRRQEFYGFSENPPAGRFETRGLVYVGHTFEGKTSASPTHFSGEERKGLGCCPGIVRARARVINDPRHAEIRPGEILVASRTDPGWIMLFPSAAGLLVEHGSLLSHSAIVAREMGIPAVVSIGGLISWLETGDLVELDGSTGRVTRIAEEVSDAK
ncbi:MAG: PEP/pyruvate-binding domain-containing protein, partial [Terrimicrobiaceae bacterium]